MKKLAYISIFALNFAVCNCSGSSGSSTSTSGQDKAQTTPEINETKNQTDIRKFFDHSQSHVFELESFDWTKEEIELFKTLSASSKKSLTQLTFTKGLEKTDLINLKASTSLFPDLKVIRSGFIEVDSESIKYLNNLVDFNSLELVYTELLNIIHKPGNRILDFQAVEQQIIQPYRKQGINLKYKDLQGPLCVREFGNNLCKVFSIHV